MGDDETTRVQPVASELSPATAGPIGMRLTPRERVDTGDLADAALGSAAPAAHGRGDLGNASAALVVEGGDSRVIEIEHSIPGMVNSMQDGEVEDSGAQDAGGGTAGASEPTAQDTFAPDASGRPVGVKWAMSGLDRKTTKLTIASARDGMLGEMTEVEVHSGGEGNRLHASREPDDGQQQGQGADGDSEAEMAMFENEQEGAILMKDEVKISRKTIQELEEEVELAAKKKRRTCCGIVSVPFQDLPELSARNPCGLAAEHPVRRRCLNMAVNPYMNGMYNLASLVHFLLGLWEIQEAVFKCKHTEIAVNGANKLKLASKCGVVLPFFHHFLFLGIYWVEAFIKITAFGFSGSQFAYWTHDVYNKFDFIATVCYTAEVILLFVFDQTFSLRALRLFRMLKPISRLELFSDLEIIFHAMSSALLPMLTIILLILFCFLFLSIIGMTLYGEHALKRRCVWADDLSLKMPEVWCSRNDTSGLSNKGSCGPFQVCVDYSYPNIGFTNFDNMFGSLMSLFQAFSTDGQYQIFWAALDSAPEHRLITVTFFLVMGVGLGHVLVNVFVAVFANVFSLSRASFQQRNLERLARIEADAEAENDRSARSSAGSSYYSGSEGPSGSLQNDSPRSRFDELQPPNPESDTHISGLGLEDQVKQIKTRQIDPLLQTYMAWLLRNSVYEFLTLLIIFVTTVALILDGSLCDPHTFHIDCDTDVLLVNIITNCNIFFLFDFVAQVLCDGSLAAHFEHGEHVFNFLVTIITSIAVIGSFMGLSHDATSVLRGFAVFRLLRVCKHGALKPIWLMMVKTANSFVAILNLALFNFILTMAWYMLGRVLFEDSLNHVNSRSNYSSISRGYMLLFQLMTGDSWANLMYEAMATFCAPPPTAREVMLADAGLGPTAPSSECDMVYLAMAALYYILYFLYGNYVFVTMFLAVILESFAVSEFMTTHVEADEEIFLTKEESVLAVAEFHKLPEELVDKRLLHRAWVKLSEDKLVSRSRLIAFYRIYAPHTRWRFCKACGLVFLRQVLRKTVLKPFAHRLNLRPWPGDSDYVLEMSQVPRTKDIDEATQDVAKAKQEEIARHMSDLADMGMTGDVFMVALRHGLVDQIDAEDLSLTPTFSALEILRDPQIARKLDIEGLYDNLIEDAMLGEVGLAMQGSEAEADGARRGLFAGISRSFSFKQKPLGLLEQAKLQKVDDRLMDATPKTKIALIVHVSRKAAKFFAMSYSFDAMVLIAIISSSVMLILETPHMGTLEPDNNRIDPSLAWLLDLACNAIFVLEALAKMLAFGFYTPLSVDHESYWQSKSNRLDLFVLMMAFAEMVGLGEYVGEKTTKIIRLMKVMRPLRMMSRSEDLKKIIVALVSSVKPVLCAVCFLLLVMVVFAVMAMAFFKNKFAICTDLELDGGAGLGRRDCLGAYSSELPEKGGLYLPRAWVTPGFGQNFDTFGSSILVLFRCITLKWVQYYVSAQDAPFIAGIQPVQGQQMFTASSFFHLYILFGSFFSLNLFVSFMCDAFYSIQGDEQLEDIQWVSVQKMIKENWPQKETFPPSNWFSSRLRRLLANYKYRLFSGGCLFLNVIFMGTEHTGQSEMYSEILYVQNTVFFGQFCVEAVLYFLAYGPSQYIVARSNQFDLCLILATTIAMIWGEEFRSLSQVVRVLRLFKLGRALSQDRTIHNVFETITVSIGQVTHIVLVLGMLVMMFSVLSVQLFGLTKFGSRVGLQINFQDFASALRSIFQILFGDEWHQVQDDCMITEPFCTPDIYDEQNPKLLLYASDCGGFVSGAIFFPALLICANYVVLNLFVGMIMNNFAYINCKDSNGAIEPADLQKISKVWVNKYDPEATGQIKLQDVYMLMMDIGEPLGLFGTTENVGRYLCVREDLICKLKSQEQGVVYRGGKLYRWAKTKYDVLHQNAQDLWKADHDAYHNAEKREKKASLNVTRKEAEFADVQAKFRLEGLGEIKRAENEALSASNKLLRGVSFAEGEQSEQVHGTNMGILESGSVRREAWIGGESMGFQADGVSQHATKKDDLRAWRAKRARELEEAQNELEAARVDKERLRAIVKKHPLPRIGLLGAVWKFWTSVFGCYLNNEEKTDYRPGYVGYLDVIDALLHWNKKRNIVPGHIMRARKERDDQVIIEVAFQLVQACILGGLARRRRRVAKEKAQKRLRMAGMSSKRLAASMGATKHVMDNREADRIKALHDSHASPDKVNQIIQDFNKGGGSAHLVTCAKIVLYGIAVGHELAEVASGVGQEVDERGVFGLETEPLESLMQHPTILGWSEHVKFLDSLKMLLDNDQLPLLMLASQVHEIQWLDEVEKMTKDDIKTLVQDPNVMAVTSNIDSYSQNRKKKHAINVTGKTSEALHLLDESMIQELEDIRTAIKEKEAENEKLNAILEETQERMFGLRDEHDALVDQAEAAKQAAAAAQEASDHPSRVRRVPYDAGAASVGGRLQSAPAQAHMKPMPSLPARPMSEHGASQSAVVARAHDGPAHRGIAAKDDGLDSSRHLEVSQESSEAVAVAVVTAEAADAAASTAERERETKLRAETANAALRAQEDAIKNDPRKIQEQIAAKKLEMERLQRQLEKARQDATRAAGASAAAPDEEIESMQDKLARAAARREAKGRQLTSASSSRVLMSPRASAPSGAAEGGGGQAASTGVRRAQPHWL